MIGTMKPPKKSRPQSSKAKISKLLMKGEGKAAQFARKATIQQIFRAFGE